MWKQLTRAVADGLVDEKYMDMKPEGRGDDCTIM